jgi:hypothetical protein
MRSAGFDYYAAGASAPYDTPNPDRIPSFPGHVPRQPSNQGFVPRPVSYVRSPQTGTSAKAAASPSRSSLSASGSSPSTNHSSTNHYLAPAARSRARPPPLGFHNEAGGNHSNNVRAQSPNALNPWAQFTAGGPSYRTPPPPQPFRNVPMLRQPPGPISPPHQLGPIQASPLGLVHAPPLRWASTAHANARMVAGPSEPRQRPTLSSYKFDNAILDAAAAQTHASPTRSAHTATATSSHLLTPPGSSVPPATSPAVNVSRGDIRPARYNPSARHARLGAPPGPRF